MATTQPTPALSEAAPDEQFCPRCGAPVRWASWTQPGGNGTEACYVVCDDGCGWKGEP